MTTLYLCSVLIFVLMAVNVNTEVFSSSGEMINLVETEVKVTEHLEYVLNKHIQDIDKAKKMLEDFKQMADLSSKNPEKYIGNPVNSFLLIKKLSRDLQKFVDTLNSYETLKKLVNELKEKFYLPTNGDYTGASIGILRLEDVYAFEPSDFRKGNFSQMYPSRSLTAEECFEIGKVAYEEQDFYHTVKWMSEALNAFEIEGQNSTVNVIDILDYLSFATAQQGNIKHALELTQKLLTYQPNHERAISNLAYYKKLLNEQLKVARGDIGEEKSESLPDPFEFQNPRPPSVLGFERDAYESLCRGEDLTLKDPKILKHLKCRYLNNKPLLYIAPIKEEQVFYDPPIWVYHDVITEKQVELMKNLAKPKLRRAIVRSPITGEFETADYRISKSAWISDNEVPKFTYLTKLVNAVTNMSMNTAEEWQIANYGIGGQYDPHFDFARKTEPGDAFHSTIGNRIATWLFYLEVPEIGGATVFPRIGARLKPPRRSAAFWYNLFTSGDGDYRTRHAACPVLTGQKWVSNKWIHMVGQEFIRPCKLYREQGEESD